MNTLTMTRPAVPATKGGTVGAEELQAYVKAVMAERGLTVAKMSRLTDISRATLTPITKGRYSNGSEKTRETLEKLAAGLGLPREELFAAAGLDPEPPPRPSVIPAEIISEVEEALRASDEATRRLRAAVEKMGRAVPPPPQPPKRTGGSRTGRTPPPEGGPTSRRHMGSRGTGR